MSPPPPYSRQRLTPVMILLLVGFSSYTTSSQSRVEYLPGFPGKLPFQLETGYIGVGESEEAQLFYYFIESERSPKDDPLLIWLQGGPGCSGFSGLIFENGPLIFDYDNSDGDIPTLLRNPYSWTKVANFIFIDQPAGAGFSYGKTSRAYKCGDTLAAKQTYEFLQKWLINHPNYLRNPLYVAGESYCGLLVPLIVNEIYNGVDAGDEPHMNMRGYILGNAVTDKLADVNGQVDYAHRMGLLSDEIYQSAKENCNGSYLIVDPDNKLCKRDMARVNQCVEKIYIYHILEPWCDLDFVDRDVLLHNTTSSYESRFLRSVPLRDSESWCHSLNYAYANKWANNKHVQEALHVREGTILQWVRCNRTIQQVYSYDVSSTVSYHEKFSHRNDCRALLLSGDHDMVAPHTRTEEWIRSLKLPIRSDWRPWFVQGQIAGYTIEYLNEEFEMTYATVKGAGHTAPEYKPKECLFMIDRWLSHSPL